MNVNHQLARFARAIIGHVGEDVHTVVVNDGNGWAEPRRIRHSLMAWSRKATDRSVLRQYRYDDQESLVMKVWCI